jgi:hypothetical protein
MAFEPVMSQHIMVGRYGITYNCSPHLQEAKQSKEEKEGTGTNDAFQEHAPNELKTSH